MAITELVYTLDSRKRVNWSLGQEKSISTDYPFECHAEPLEQYVARTYLQFLWLPESIMPLHLLVPSLQRVNAPSASNASIHPMHAFLAPLLLTTRSSANKYHIELPQILSDGGGAGEIEETMMWFALTHEKADEETQSRLPESADGPWVIPEWRQKYLQRMERREVQVQILLHFLKLSLPGPAPPPPGSSKKRKRSREPSAPSTTIEDELEAFMDKLSMWQLIHNLDVAGIPGTKIPSPSRTFKEERDWIQIFAEDVVERQFKTQLPDACDLLRSKVFPSSPFSDASSNASASRNVSPELEFKAVKKGIPSTSRLPSPTLSTSSRTTTKSKLDPRALARSRSRSLSVSLAQEKERERVASAAPPKKRVLNREISMSRVFKPKLKPNDKATSERRPKPETAAPVRTKAKDLGITLVEETPVKPRLTSTKTLSFGQASLGIAPIKDLKVIPKNPRKDGTFLAGILDEDDEEWMVNSSPDIMLLVPKQNIGSFGLDSEGEAEEAQATPSKVSRKRR